MDTLRVVEGGVAGIVLAVVLAIAVVQLLRWWRRRRREPDWQVGEPALSVFADTEDTNPASFGGGAWSARVRARKDTVTYGYLAVAEEYASPDTGGRWVTLTVTLPGRVPFLVADNRAATGRSGVPMDAPYRATVDDPPFDATYVVGADDPDSVGRVLSPGARDVLLRSPVQRLLLHENCLQLRTFDGVTLSEETIASLDGIAARFLGSTPSFVSALRTPATSGGLPDSSSPLPEGFYGPDAD